MRPLAAPLLLLLACAPREHLTQLVVPDEVVTSTRVEAPTAQVPGPLAGATSLALGIDQRSRHLLCAIVAEGKVRCLGDNGLVDVALTGPATRIAVNFGFGCAFVGARVECWGDGPLITRLKKVQAGKDLVLFGPEICVRRQDDTVACVRFTMQGDETEHNPYEFSQGTTVRSFGARCVLDSKGLPHCRDMMDMPAGDYRAWQTLAVAQTTRRLKSTLDYSNHALGLDDQGGVLGMGSNFYGQLGLGPNQDVDRGRIDDLGAAQQLAVAPDHACALVSGRVACWGESSGGQVPRRVALPLPACTVDQPATRAAYELIQRHDQLNMEQCMKRFCPPGGLDCHLGCHIPSRPPTAPEYFWIYRHAERCLEQASPSLRTLEPRPVWVPGLADAMQIAVEPGLSCALRSGGQIQCWGSPTNFAIDATGTPRQP